MPLIKTSTGYRFESTGREIPNASFPKFMNFEYVNVLADKVIGFRPSERKELAEYMIHRWAEWGGVESFDKEMDDKILSPKTDTDGKE